MCRSATVVKRKQNASIEESTKILVRNIPFQASIQEVIELFKYDIYTNILKNGNSIFDYVNI